MWLVTHLISILGFTVALVLIGKILRERRPPGSTLGWLVTLVLAPYLGVPLYFLFGGRKARRAARKKDLQLAATTTSARADQSAVQRVLRIAGMPETTNGNRIELLSTGEASYSALIDLIRTAQESVQIATFILGNDETGHLVLGELEKKAAAGVRVQLLLDGLFAMRSGGREKRSLEKAGAEIACFMPLLQLPPFRGHANLRNHRKIVVVDGRRGIVGGMNIAQEYMGPAPLLGRWRDVSMRVDGPVVEHLAALFRADWGFAIDHDVEPPKAPVVFEEPGDSSIQLVASGPDVPSDAFYDALLTVLFEAKERIWIATPYFVPDETLARALVLAAKRGVDVRILVPARSNHWVADLVAASYMRQVRDAGARLCLYRGGMMHAKISIIDNQVATVGSANMDIRSLFLDYEIALFLYSQPDIERLASWYESALVECDDKFPAPTAMRALCEDLGRLLAPLT